MKPPHERTPAAHKALFAKKLYFLILKVRIFNSKTVMIAIKNVNLFSLEICIEMRKYAPSKTLLLSLKYLELIQLSEVLQRVLWRAPEREDCGGGGRGAGGALWVAETAPPDRETGQEGRDVKDPGEIKRIHFKVACSLPHNSNYYQRGG